MDSEVAPPRIVAWEITRRCNLYCAHCRASATCGPYPDELSTEECLSVVDQLSEMGRPMLILTGGEPLLRADFFRLARYAARKGLRVTVGCNGTVLSKEMAASMKDVPVARVAVSLDFPRRELQDGFRGMPGAFDAALEGIRNAREAGLQVQVNATVTRLNAPYLDDLVSLALEVGAVAFHPFLLVPTGRGKGLEKEELPPEEYERVLEWTCRKQLELGDRMFFKPTDAPHYMRVRLQYGGRSRADRGAGHPGAMGALTRGCLAGTGFCFISHLGRVQGCGYLDIEAGDLRRQSFREVWLGSKLFRDIRDLSMLRGKCGLCEYKKICGGCRARAFEATGDYLAAEPYCVYQPRMGRVVV
ncbi:MAG: radical SAM protein [Chloroflexota bacterium]